MALQAVRNRGSYCDSTLTQFGRTNNRIELNKSKHN